MGNTWQSEEAWIFIGRPQHFAIRGTTRSSDLHQTATIVRDLGDARSLLVRPISITRTAANRADHGDRADHDRLYLHRMALDRPDLLPLWRRVDLSRALDFHRTMEDNRGRTPRSRFDRAAIGELTWWNRRHSSGQRSTNDLDHDRGPIVARSWLKWWLFESKMEADSTGNWSHDIVPRNRSHEAMNQPPQPHQLATIFGPIFLFKSIYFPPLFFNFWSIREGIKRISRKISSSSWSPRV